MESGNFRPAMTESELQSLFLQSFVLAGDRETAYELLYDFVKEYARRHPRGLKQVFPYAYRLLQEFAASRGIGENLVDPASEEPKLAPREAVEPLADDELARLEGAMAGLMTGTAHLFSESD